MRHRIWDKRWERNGFGYRPLPQNAKSPIVLFEGQGWDLTLRELVFSVLIVGVMVLVGFFVSEVIERKVNDSNLRYNQAVALLTNDEFKHALDTDVGYVFGNGRLVADSPVKNEHLEGEYLSVLPDDNITMKAMRDYFRGRGNRQAVSIFQDHLGIANTEEERDRCPAQQLETCDSSADGTPTDRRTTARQQRPAGEERKDLMSLTRLLARQVGSVAVQPAGPVKSQKVMQYPHRRPPAKSSRTSDRRRQSTRQS